VGRKAGAAWKPNAAPKVDEEVNAYLETKVQPVDRDVRPPLRRSAADLLAQREAALAGGQAHG
jgi:2-oxoisovalerate dehydrogenase E1 component alpha subunit